MHLKLITPCHSEPFGATQGRLREESLSTPTREGFLVPIAPNASGLGMTNSGEKCGLILNA